MPQPLMPYPLVMSFLNVLPQPVQKQSVSGTGAKRGNARQAAHGAHCGWCTLAYACARARADGAGRGLGAQSQHLPFSYVKRFCLVAMTVLYIWPNQAGRLVVK